MAAQGVDPATLHLTGTVNGEVRQDATGADLIFTFAQLIADLSRFMTLEPGDVILTGTPAGADVVAPGDVVEVTLEGAGSVTSTIVEATSELARYGAMPRATAEARAFATGANPPRPAPTPAAARGAQRRCCRGAAPGVDGHVDGAAHPPRHPDDVPDAVCGPRARTCGWSATPARCATSPSAPTCASRMQGTEDAQKRAVESVSPGDVLIMEARGETGAGTIGDILAARVLARGGAGHRHRRRRSRHAGRHRSRHSDLLRAANASSLWNAHIPLDIDVPITCAGVLVMPGDVIVGDAEGVVVLPRALAEEIAHAAREVEEREAFALERVKAGEPFRGLYPLSEERRADFENWKATRGEDPSP